MCNRIFVMIFCLAIVFMALIPKALNYQGKLLDTGGIAIDGNRNMTFRLYTSETTPEGSYLWEKTLNNVPISKGLFSVELTDFPDSVDFSSQYYLEVQIGTEIVGPREKLLSAPYSIRSEYTSNAIQSVFSDSNATRRTGNFVFRPGPGATMSDDGSNINITIGSCSGGSSGATPNIYDVLVSGNDAGGRGIHNLIDPTNPQDVATKSYVDNQSVSSIIGGAALSPDDASVGDVTLNVNVDNVTIDINEDKLRVKPGGINTTQIAEGAITTNRIANGAVTTTQIATGSITNDRIATGAVTINQLADFTLTGTVKGDVLYYDGSKWINLGPGSNGQVLTTHGVGNSPSWNTPAALAIFNFLLDIKPSSDGVEAGLGKSTNVVVTGISGGEQQVTFYTRGLPTGVTSSFSPLNCTPPNPTGSCSTAMNISTLVSATRGTFPITITGITPGGSQTAATYNLTIASVPGAISDLSATDSLGTVTLNWTAPSDNGGSLITNYIIYRGTSPNPTTPIDTVSSGILTFTDTGLAGGYTYYYTIRAVNSIGRGAPSNEVNIRVLLIYATGGDSVYNDGNFRIHKFKTVGSSTFQVISGSTNSAEVLVVAGGGGGAMGGGGAGGFRDITGFSLASGSYSVTVGAGGVGRTDNSNGKGENGSASVFSTITSAGGGGGGITVSIPLAAGANGGSGGGGARYAGGQAGGSGNTPSTSPSQGNNGGTCIDSAPGYGSGGGGGAGAGAVGSNGTTTAGGAGGAGTSSSISGTPVIYAGGGGGAAQNSGYPGGAGGSGGGGAGGGGVPGTAGTSNTGGGGGGGENGSNVSKGANGGSGIVIVRYPI